MAVEWGIAAVVFVGVSAVLWGFSRWMTGRIEAAVPINGRFVEVDGERFHYVEEGEGPPLVMIHGLMGNSRNLTYALSGQLREHFRVITSTVRGRAIPPVIQVPRRTCQPRRGKSPGSSMRWAWINRWCWAIPWAVRFLSRSPSTIPMRCPAWYWWRR
jgi:hypothetical protein